ncbi:hypothetical protein [Kocuria rosea]|uniref:hypothetical protein n=1 Tax=Kocuria rosea TaxID=1275 RepID=UPI0012F7CA6B|nr:hypothetical protein [Kocuria polaris]
MNDSNTRTRSKYAQLPSRDLELRWPWWLHPAWAAVVLVASTALLAVLLPSQYYETWGVEKFLDIELSLKVLIGVTLVIVGIVVGGGGKARSGNVQIKFTGQRLRYLKKAYQVLLWLTILGYAFWTLIAISEGVRVDSLLAVMQRDTGAISELKQSSRPVGGVTTLTQFGPIAVVIGYVLRRVGVGGRSYWSIIALAVVRAVFYAERLALLEILVPLVLVAGLTIRRGSKWRPIAQVMPLVLGPLVWLVFALSEYSRSWVYYQKIVALPFNEWVTSRLLGYYITSYNNSALFAREHESVYAPPYMTLQAFWNAPGIDGVVATPQWMGLSPEGWWRSILQAHSNPEFNNTGSFLVVYAEMGWLFGSIFLLLIGIFMGSCFSSLKRGSLPGFLAYTSLFIGLLELPRFLYWTQGRAVPVLLALVVIAWTWARYGRQLQPSRKGVPANRHR